VKYEFESRDDRIRAESALRDVCGIQCTTPYLTVIRECIKQIVNKVKAENPNNLVRVNIDTNNLCFKIALRAKSSGDSYIPWVHYNTTVPIPELALDINLRKVPENFKVSWPALSPQKSPQKSPRKSSVSSMEVNNDNVTPEGESQ
jgi:hypothetical protein